MFEKFLSRFRKPVQEEHMSFGVKEIPEVDKKAFLQETSTNAWQFFFGVSSNKQYTPKQLLQYNTGYVYSCNNKIGQTIAKVPLKLFYKGKTPKLSQHKAISRATRKFIEVTTKQAMDDVVEITTHPALTLTERINDRMNFSDMTYLVHGYLGLIGNSYIYKERDENNTVVNLYPLQAEFVTVIMKQNPFGYGKIEKYKYCSNDTDSGVDEKNAVYFKPEDIMHIANFQPGNMLYGKGELEACLSCAERAMYYDQVENYLNRNNARPDFLVVYKNGLKEAEQKEIARMWYKKYGTPMNAGKPMITGGDVDVKQLGFSPRDMQYQLGRETTKKEICAVYGVPEALIDINESNFASAKSAMNHFMEFTIHPKLSKYLNIINQQLISEYDPNLFFWYDDYTSIDAKEQADIDKVYIDSGVYGPTYVRNRIGIDPNQDDAERAAMKPKETLKDE